MTDTLWADVSSWQVAVDNSYPYPVLAIRSNDGTYRDPHFSANYAWGLNALKTGRLQILIVYFDLARAWAQAEGPRDQEAVRALDAADRLAPVRLRNDPIARDLVVALNRRAPRRVWELDSLRNRFGVGKVNNL